MKLDLHDIEVRTRVIAVALIVAVGITGIVSWQVSQSERHTRAINTTADRQAKPPTKAQLATLKKEAAGWQKVATAHNTISMVVPDGWNMISFPDDHLGATAVNYIPGKTPTIQSVDSPYASYELRLNIRVTTGNGNAALKPQWESPQPGLTQTVTDFTSGTYQGKRFRGIFNNSLHQTLYQYVFDLGKGKRLSIVYTIYNGDKTDLATVEQAIRSISVK